MTTPRASKKQQELLQFIDGFIQGHGYGPSYREVMRALGYRSVSTVAAHVDQLIIKGYLEKKDNSARSLMIVKLRQEASPGKISPAEKEIKEKIVELQQTNDDESVLVLQRALEILKASKHFS